MEIIQNKVGRSSNILTFSTKGNHQKRADNQNHWHDDIYIYRFDNHVFPCLHCFFFSKHILNLRKGIIKTFIERF